MPDCYCKREYLDPSVRRMRSNDGIVHGVNGCFSSGETGVGGRGSRAPNCEVCDERWPCTDATIAQVLAKPYLNARPHGQPDPWREGYNQALREVRDTLMEGNHE